MRSRPERTTDEEMTPRVPGALKFSLVAAVALALVLPASAIDGFAVGTSCHREATACDANAECSTCRGELGRGVLATECQGYSGLLGPRPSFCKVLEASYCCNVGESGQTQACLAEDLMMEYLECLLGGWGCSAIEDMPCYGEESRASVTRALSAPGGGELSSVDAGYGEDSGRSPSPSYSLTTTASQLNSFASATGPPTSMAVGSEGGLGSGVVKGTLSATGVPMSLVDEVGEEVAVQEVRGIIWGRCFSYSHRERAPAAYVMCTFLVISSCFEACPCRFHDERSYDSQFVPRTWRTPPSSRRRCAPLLFALEDLARS